ncbi:MAG TPA: hypothetical protein VGR21_08275, partial [Cryptosporangiaceae bacterium]|nr:hypothetical protein [Cryptosporangiaceae bacterium]
MSMAALRAVLRIARRDALRSRGRSALVVAMIALPVLGLVTGLTVLRSFELTPDERADRTFGTADALVRRVAAGAVMQDPLSMDEYQEISTAGREATGPPAPEDLAAAERRILAILPAGSRVQPQRSGGVTARTTGGQAGLDARELDYGSPLAQGMIRPLSGRAPRTSEEVALTPRASVRTGARVGDRIELLHPRRTYTVVALVEDPAALNGITILGRPGALLPAVLSGPPDPGLPPGKTVPVQDSPIEWLVDAPAPLAWNDVMRLNAQGVVGLSRAVLRDPPPAEAVPLNAARAQDGSEASPAIALGALAGGLVLLEIVLLAGPAFA